MISQDTLLLLEKRVKSRFSHRMWRVSSPLAPDGIGWAGLLKSSLIPWDTEDAAEKTPGKEDKQAKKWKGDWQFAVEVRDQHEPLPTFG